MSDSVPSVENAMEIDRIEISVKDAESFEFYRRYPGKLNWSVFEDCILVERDSTIWSVPLSCVTTVSAYDLDGKRHYFRTVPTLRTLNIA